VVPELHGEVLQPGEDRRADPAAPGRRDRVHPLDLPDPVDGFGAVDRVVALHRAAADELAVEAGHHEAAVRTPHEVRSDLREVGRVVQRRLLRRHGRDVGGIADVDLGAQLLDQQGAGGAVVRLLGEVDHPTSSGRRVLCVGDATISTRSPRRWCGAAPVTRTVA
jgi:hypothetical protein